MKTWDQGVTIQYGIQVSDEKPLMFNRKTESCLHMAVIGASGSGKGTIIRSEIAQVINNTKDDVIIVGDSNYKLPGVESNILDDERFINPLDIVLSASDDNEDPISCVSDTVVGMFIIIMNRVLSPTEIQIIDYVTNRLFTPFVKDLKERNRQYDFEKNPTIKDIIDLVKCIFKDADNGFISKTTSINGIVLYEDKIPFKCAEFINELDLATEALLPWLSRRTNVNLDARIIHLCPDKLSSVARKICDVAIINFVMNRTKINYLNKRYTWVYFDDIAEYTEQTGDRFDTMRKQIRSYGGILTLGMNHFDNNDKYRRILLNTDIIQLLRMPTFDLYDLSQLLFLTIQEAKNIRSFESGEAYFCSNREHIRIKY